MTTMSVRTAAAWAITSQYTSFAIQFVTSVILARWFITPADLGLFSIAFAAVSLISFLQDFGITRYINGERDLTAEKIQTAFSVSALFAFAIAVAALLAAWPITWFYGDVRLLPITLVVAASYLTIPFAVVPQALCQRKLDYRSNTMIEVGSALANASVAMFLALKGHGALALAWGAFAQQAARMIVAQWRIGGMLPWPLRFGGTADIVAIGKTNSVVSVCYAIDMRAPELLIGRVLGTVATGLFSRAAGLALQLRSLVAGAVSGVFYPAFRAVRDRGEPLGPPYLRVVAAYTGVAWPAMAGIAALAWPLVDLLYGERWLATAPLLFWVALSQLCYVAVPLQGDLPILLGRMPQLVRLYIIDTIVSVAMLALAAPFGLGWVAISRLAHGLFWVVLFMPFMKGMLQFSWRELAVVWSKSAAVTLAAIAPVLLAYALWRSPQQLGVPAALSLPLLGIACWLIALRATRHPLLTELLGLMGDLRSALVRKPGPTKDAA